MKLGKWDSKVDRKAYIIGDVGSNHMGDEDQAVAHIRWAAQAGVDSVKFQLFSADTIYPPQGSADYLGSQSLHSVLKKYELNPKWIPELKKQCDGYGVDFACTPFSLEAVDILNPYVSFWKIASFELNWHALIKKCRDTGKPIVLSSGGASFPEIAEAVKVAKLVDDEFNMHSNVALLQCTSEYPANPASVNLWVINSWLCGGYEGESGYTYSGIWDYVNEQVGNTDLDLARSYGVPEVYGLSDHTDHPSLAPCAAVVIGARIIEKHFTIRKDLPSPDAKFALDPKQMKQMVDDIRMTERMLGSSKKEPQPGELSLYKRTLYATENIPAGAVLTEQNTACLRNTGKPNPAPPQALGKALRLPVSSGSMIQTGDLE